MAEKYMAQIYKNLNPTKALIWRITHIDNLPWILEHGLYCANAQMQASNFRQIGNPELIIRRRTRSVTLAPGGSLGDYIPFYFTPFSPMLFNIKTGRGVAALPNEEIIIRVSSLRLLEANKIEFLFTDRHAYLDLANYFNNLEFLENLEWDLWQRRDFQRDSEDPEKMDRYQAEALVYQHLPISHLTGIVCYTDVLKLKIETQIRNKGLSIQVVSKPGWYF